MTTVTLPLETLQALYSAAFDLYDLVNEDGSRASSWFEELDKLETALHETRKVPGIQRDPITQSIKVGDIVTFKKDWTAKEYYAYPDDTNVSKEDQDRIIIPAGTQARVTQVVENMGGLAVFVAFLDRPSFTLLFYVREIEAQ